MASKRASRTSQPIFIHAMWRTCSTYVWKKFRDQPQYRAYYEPLHELLVNSRDQALSHGHESRGAQLRHPSIDRPYFAEFPFAARAGVSYFEKALSYERFCLQEDERDDALHRYIANLISCATGKKQRPVLQFNRSLLRCGWLARNFSPVNILVLRDPASIWKSMLSFADGSFVGVLCIVLGQNKLKAPLKYLPDWLDLPCRVGRGIQDDYAAYAPIAAELTRRMYTSFFDFYLAATLHCARYADCILDIDELSSNRDARTAAEMRLRHFGIEMSFSDCFVPSYALNSNDEREWLAYEEFARPYLRKQLPAELLLPSNAFDTNQPLLGKYFLELLGEFTEPARRRRTKSSRSAAVRAAEMHAEGIRLFERGDAPASVRKFGESLADEPNSERWNDWATAQAACSRLTLAELGYRQALQLDNWNREAAGNLGAVLASGGRNSEALPLLERARRAANDESAGALSAILVRVRKAIAATAASADAAGSAQPKSSRTGRRDFELASNPLGGFTIFFTGLSGAGKTSLAGELCTTLLAMGVPAITMLDGDAVREHLSSELGFSKQHRDLNVRRIGFVAAQVTRHGGVAICAAISPFDLARKEARAMVEDFGAFVLVHVATPLAICEQRDCKGLYAKARAGLLLQFTGISDPYEEPCDADVRIDASRVTVEQGTRRILSYLISHSLIAAAEGAENALASASYG
jgi:adenylyl-sulfate kinase